MQPTRDHDEIRRWADKHGAVPAEVKRRKFDGEPALLRFLFGEAVSGTPELLPISWEDFFARFDLMDLSLAFEDDSSQFAIVRVEKGHESRISN